MELVKVDNMLNAQKMSRGKRALNQLVNFSNAIIKHGVCSTSSECDFLTQSWYLQTVDVIMHDVISRL